MLIVHVSQEREADVNTLLLCYIKLLTICTIRTVISP
jgi:hypothetical protein